MAKRLMVLLGMVALALTTALPAFAQEMPQYGGEEIAATGVLREGLPQDVGGIGTHSITDDATGELYALRSAGADLASFEGQQVTVYGALTPGEEGSGEEGFEGNGTLPSIDVTRVEPVGAPNEGEEIVVSFELSVEGEPPTGTTFFGGASQQTVGLADPDGDGTYTGSL